MRIIMNDTKLGSPNGVTVQEYTKDTAYDVPADLANAFISAGVAISDEPKEAATLTWPPTEEQIGEASFSVLGVWLESKGVSLGALKSVESREVAIRDLIAADQNAGDGRPVPGPSVLPTDEEIDGMDESALATMLTARGVDIAPIPGLPEARLELKGLIAKERAAQG